MRKSTIVAVAALMVMNATSCVQGLLEDTDLKDRVARLEGRCDELNRDLQSLTSILNAMGSGDWITDVTPVTEDGVMTGYLVNFYMRGPILIPCGKDGKDGQDGISPKLGITEGEDGSYYWTLNGNLLTDASGNPVMASAQTPQLKIENDSWYVSYDSGKRWILVGPSTSGSGNEVFASVTVDAQAGTVLFMLMDGSVFTVRMKPAIDITFDTDILDVPVGGGETITVQYTLSGADENTVVSASSDGNYQVSVKSEGPQGGRILITAPKEYTDGFVNVLLSDGKGYSWFKVINFYERKGYVSGTGNAPSYTVSTTGGNLEIPLTVNFPYTVKTNVSWIQFVDTRASLHTDRLQFVLAKNEQSSVRTGTISIIPDNTPSVSWMEITVVQASAYFSIDKPRFLADAKGDTFTAEIHTSKTFQVNIPSEASWLQSTVTPVSTDGYTLTLTAAENAGTERRQATVRFLGVGNDLLASIDVVQFASTEDDRAPMILTVHVNYANDFTVKLPLCVKVDAMIDWGDGIIEHCKDEYPSHTYSGFKTGRDFDVKITGEVRSLGSRIGYNTSELSDLDKKAIIAVKQWGRTSLRSLYSSFRGCTNLKTIPGDDDLSFAGVTDATYAFSGCTGLVSIPENLFANCQSVTSFGYTFSGCTGLTSIPGDLFANCPSVTSFGHTFSGCTGLTSIPGDLFAICPSVTSFEYTFSGCAGLTSISGDLFANCSFVTSFGHTFSGCTGLTSIPGDLFANCSSVTSFGHTFSDCTGLTSIPDDLFVNCPSVTFFGYIFSGCTGLTSIPANLFTNCPSVSSFGNAFSHCTGLTMVPESIFDNNRKVNSFYGTFQFTNIAGESPYTVINGNKIHLYERADYPDYFHAPSEYSNCFSTCKSLTDYDAIPSSWR